MNLTLTSAQGFIGPRLSGSGTMDSTASLVLKSPTGVGNTVSIIDLVPSMSNPSVNGLTTKDIRSLYFVVAVRFATTAAAITQGTITVQYGGATVYRGSTDMDAYGSGFTGYVTASIPMAILYTVATPASPDFTITINFPGSNTIAYTVAAIASPMPLGSSVLATDVNVINTPSVTVASGAVTATISGTPNVAVANTPSVTVSSGAVTATISGTPNVAVTNTPAVTVSGTPNVAVTNTPAVTVSGTPNVAVTNTPNVAVTNTPTVTIGSQPVSVTTAV